MPTALRIVAGMIGWNATVLPTSLQYVPGVHAVSQALHIPIAPLTLFWNRELYWLPVLFWIVWFMPNVGQWMHHYQTALGPKFRAIWYERWMRPGMPFATWHPTVACGFIVSAIGLVALLRAFSNAPTEFLYFKF
jgi:alginate O-acetyltransferase complex protein AlgI